VTAPPLRLLRLLRLPLRRRRDRPPLRPRLLRLRLRLSLPLSVVV